MRAPWRYFGYGALVFFVFQILTRVPAMQLLQRGLKDVLAASPRALFAWIAFAALTAGLFEEGGRYLGFRILWKKDEAKGWPQALMYGAGHGGLESMLLVGGAALLSLIQVLALSQLDLQNLSLTPEQLEQVRQAREAIAAATWWMPLLGALERVLALTIQISLSVLVVQVFVRGRFFWWWLALGYHFVVDLVTALALQWGQKWLGQEVASLVVEGIAALFAFLSAWMIYRLRPQAATEAVPTA
ncbi:MAG: YhfC family intramembrane metalloprotease [Chloroflexia bacterium]